MALVQSGPFPPFVAPAACRHDRGQDAVWLLFVAEIGEPFFVDGDRVKIIQPGFGRDLRIAGPAVLFALRAVGRITKKIDRYELFVAHQILLIVGLELVILPIGETSLCIKYPVRPFFCERDRLCGGDFHILKAFIIKTRLENLCSLALEDIDIGLERIGVVGGR